MIGKDKDRPEHLEVFFLVLQFGKDEFQPIFCIFCIIYPQSDEEILRNMLPRTPFYAIVQYTLNLTFFFSFLYKIEIRLYPTL